MYLPLRAVLTFILQLNLRVLDAVRELLLYISAPREWGYMLNATCKLQYYIWGSAEQGYVENTSWTPAFTAHVPRERRRHAASPPELQLYISAPPRAEINHRVVNTAHAHRRRSAAPALQLSTPNAGFLNASHARPPVPAALQISIGFYDAPSHDNQLISVPRPPGFRRCLNLEVTVREVLPNDPMIPIPIPLSIPQPNHPNGLSR
ncbi:hypothetical protein FB451DRAFT_1516951 [Mycena latifolia]|nr:hypothetical protein FB451DRAFT_1516951 [Mycena latifolia]